jgi:hypothetical protein
MMATRSTIALEYADGTVDQIYCHWDGYLSHNGALLLEHYSDPFKLQKMIELGDMSSLRPDIGVKHDFSQFESSIPSEEYERLYGDMCTFYGRDRGEDSVKARRFKDYDDYRNRFHGEEYNYILRPVNGQAVWFVEFYDKFDGSLIDAFKQEEIAV